MNNTLSKQQSAPEQILSLERQNAELLLALQRCEKALKHALNQLPHGARAGLIMDALHYADEASKGRTSSAANAALQEALEAPLFDVLGMHTNLSTDAMDELAPLLAAQALRTMNRATATAAGDLSDAKILEIAQGDEFESAGATPYCYSETALIALARRFLTRPACSTAGQDVMTERQRQKDVEGWTPEHDDEHDCGEMADAAACYAANAGSVVWANQVPSFWPWANDWWKPSTPRRDLVKAGALILAEIERIDRAAAK